MNLDALLVLLSTSWLIEHAGCFVVHDTQVGDTRASTAMVDAQLLANLTCKPFTYAKENCWWIFNDELPTAAICSCIFLAGIQFNPVLRCLAVDALALEAKC